MINNYMSRFSFFDQVLYETNKMNMISISESLLKKGHDAVLEFINQKISIIKPSRIVIDPLTVLGDILKSFEERPVSDDEPVSYTHLRAHETKANLVCRL